AHGRDAEGCRAAARRLARPGGRGQGGGPGGARRQPRGEHRRHAPHRVGHAPGTDPLPRFAEGHMDKVRLALVAAAVIGACGRGETGNGARAYDLILKDGWIVDGGGNPRYWRDLDGYFVQLAKHGTALNIATFVGATQVRLAVMGKDDRQPTDAELAHMVAIVDTLMQQGALGLWTALEYAPASYSKTDEIIA